MRNGLLRHGSNPRPASDLSCILNIAARYIPIRTVRQSGSCHQNTYQIKNDQNERPIDARIILLYMLLETSVAPSVTHVVIWCRRGLFWVSGSLFLKKEGTSGLPREQLRTKGSSTSHCFFTSSESPNQAAGIMGRRCVFSCRVFPFQLRVLKNQAQSLEVRNGSSGKSSDGRIWVAESPGHESLTSHCAEAPTIYSICLEYSLRSYEGRHSMAPLCKGATSLTGNFTRTERELFTIRNSR